MAQTITVPLRHRDGRVGGRLDLRPLGRAAGGTGQTFVREAAEYRHTVHIDSGDPVHIEPSGLFDFDADPHRPLGLRSGRFRTQNYVGTLEVVVDVDTGERLLGVIEVHSTKLDYDSQYRWMLSGVASEGAELLLRSFGPTSVLLAPDFTADASTIYQQVAFLAAILRRPQTVEAFERVLRAPHITYIDNAIEHPVGRGLPGSSAAVRAVLRPGARVPARAGLTVDSIPERVSSGWPEATVDNPPNRLVRFVLEHWAAVLTRAWEALDADTAENRRGRREIVELLDLVDAVRTDRRLRAVGPLGQWPTGNQVVLRQPGYRDIHQAFLESLAAAMLRWDGVEDLNRAGQRDVALLYEYWCYLELRRIMERLCHYADSAPLVELSDGGLHLRLRRGTQRAMSGFVTCSGRLIDVELWFNRTFRSEDESWTLEMRPDCSLRLSAQTATGPGIETWVHFDAKYRVESASEMFVDDDDTLRAARRTDLLKMHAYRDAIRGSAGAYVLFPGGDRRLLRQYYEVLPGLGAMPFVPGADGHATRDSAEPLVAFIDDLITHVAEQASNRERAEYWTSRAHSGPPASGSPTYVPLERPPADTTVLLGFYRSEAHLRWIEDHRLYNMRFGDRPGAVQLTGDEAAAELLVLWTNDESPARIWWLAPELRLLNEADLLALRYPTTPRGDYLCRTLTEVMTAAPQAPGRVIGALTHRRRFGQPMATTWATLSTVLS